jgi:hypothetical protein
MAGQGSKGTRASRVFQGSRGHLEPQEQGENQARTAPRAHLGYLEHLEKGVKMENPEQSGQLAPRVKQDPGGQRGKGASRDSLVSLDHLEPLENLGNLENKDRPAQQARLVRLDPREKGVPRERGAS